MTTPEQPPDQPILERIKTAVHSATDIARTLQIEHETAERIHRLLVIRHAALVELSDQANEIATASVEMSEQASQAVIDSSDSVNASATLVSNQAVSMTRMEKFADGQTDAQQVVQTADVLFSDDVVSILHVLRIMKRPRITEAARQMKRSEVADIIDALLQAVE